MLTLEETVGLLDSANPQAKELTEYLVENQRRDDLIFVRKEKNLVEVIDALLKRRRFPLVDKRLRLVIGGVFGAHQLMRYKLFQYHAREEWMGRIAGAADEYLYQGMGYLISGATIRGRLVVGRRYRPSQYDKDVFMVWSPDYV